jgi:hypothetical protein
MSLQLNAQASSVYVAQTSNNKAQGKYKILSGDIALVAKISLVAALALTAVALA